ncbi:outer membrane protein OmpK [Ferrimonas sp. SCSIO 43195]|uniref:outer membrane protein OmpK n=1 Tax=Ferrimonas sp. SCSIO 43195 TaxID=2822844 RepID=UPI002075F870|nr:outer membrane protein OmpK [Ferrimonas sp. SCSIO 43195]
MMKTLNATLVAATMACACLPAHAGMLAVEAGLMDWGSQAEDHFGKGKSENSFIKIKGATGNAFGDLYAHVQLEDVEDSEMIGSEINIVGQINIGQSDFNWYGQVFNKQKPVWSETNTLLGLSWDKTYDNDLYAQLAVAGHIVTADYKHFDGDFEGGFNGGYVIYTLSKGFSLGEHAFSMVWWQEHYFGRDDLYLSLSGDGEDFGLNGSAILRWHATDSLSASLTYKYANNNLGKEGFHDGLFYGLQYTF